MKVKIKTQNRVPKYATLGSAGCDLFAIADHPFAPNERKIIYTGIYLEIEEGYEGQIRSRSGMTFKKGLVVANAPGTIDSDYRGEIGVILHNISDRFQYITAGDAIAQIVFAKYEKAEFEQVDELSAPEERIGGFGSTGNMENHQSIPGLHDVNRIGELKMNVEDQFECICAKEAMARGANRDVVDWYERDCRLIDCNNKNKSHL